MDSEQRKRITSNITFLKERLGYMDPILDRLVEKNVLTMEQRERIEKVQPPTPHKKFNEFIQFLLASPDPGTFPSFIASLEDERYFNIVERLQKDGMFYQTFGVIISLKKITISAINFRFQLTSCWLYIHLVSSKYQQSPMRTTCFTQKQLTVDFISSSLAKGF